MGFNSGFKGLRKVRLLLNIPKAKYALTKDFQKFVSLPDGGLGLEFTQQFIYFSCEKKERNNATRMMLQGHWVWLPDLELVAVN